MNDPIRFDWDREQRSGLPEVVFAQGKQPAQIASIISAAAARDHRLLITRLSGAAHEQVQAMLDAAGGPALDYDELSATAMLGCQTRPVADEADAPVGIVCAGTSDLPVACEARRTLQYLGRDARLYADVGVAGLWRLLDVVEPLRRHAVLIAVAGMEGALFSVLAGLVPGLVIAVPTSVGYGVATGGKAALSSALASCSPGLVVVNIDNGFGAATAAHKMLAVHDTPRLGAAATALKGAG